MKKNGVTLFLFFLSTLSYSQEEQHKQSSSSTPGQIFSSPGVHQLPQSLSYSGKITAVQITSSHVTLDLNEMSIVYAGPTSYNQVNGIVIQAGCSNITIQNGTIIGFPGTAILLQGLPSKAVCHVTLKNLAIYSCGQGVQATTTYGAILENCLITSTSGASQTSIAGISFTQSAMLYLNNISVLSTSNTQGASYGFYFSNCMTTEIVQSTAYGNSASQICAGFCLSNMIGDTYLSKCTSRSNKSTTNSSYGFLIESSNATSITTGKAIANSSYQPSYGMYLQNSHNCSIIDSLVSLNSYGIYDDEQAEAISNTYLKNTGINNSILDFCRPYTTPFPYTTISQSFLRAATQASNLENLSITFSS